MALINPESEVVTQLAGSLSSNLFWISFVVIISFSRYFIRKYFSSLRDIPGPFLASISRVWKVYYGLKGNIHYKYQDLHEKYGPVVRIGFNEVSFASPDAAKQIYSVSTGFHKTDAYSVYPPPENPDIFTETDEFKHAIKRRMVSNAYSHKTIADMERFVDKTEERLFRQLDERFIGSESKECDLGSWLEFYAFDVIGEIVFSKDFGFLSSGTDRDNAIQFIESSFAYHSVVSFVPNYHKYLLGNPLLKFLAPPKSLLSEIALREIGVRHQGGKELDRRDLLSRFFEAKETHPDKMTDLDIFAISHGALIAGSDSTASSLRAMLYYMLKNPQTYASLKSEIDEFDREGKLSNPISYAEANKMPYLQAVMKEAMRMHPAVGISMPRYVPPKGAEIDGRWYPGGTVVGVNAWVIHRNKEVFGEDADRFRPERWLEDDSKAKVMARNMYQFGAGSHVCIGKNISLLEMTKLIPQLLRTYDIKLVDPDLVWTMNCQFFVKQKGLKVYLEKRRR
ncbi:cytochrome P450 [Hyaloscypha variabilis]